MSEERARRRAKLKAEDDRIGEVFRISFTSLIILLLAFFVFLASLTEPDVIRSANVRESLDAHFSEPAAAKEPESAQALAKLAESAHFQVTKLADQMLITMPGASTFESGSDVVLPDVLPALHEIAALVQKLNLSAVIEGHTDIVPIRTEHFRSNWELSAARATAVLRLFLEHGISSDRLAAAGRAEFRPVASNETEEGRARNRRVELLISSAPINKDAGT